MFHHCFHYLIIRHVWVGPLLATSIAQHRDQGSETKVIVVLLGQLLHCQGVQGEDFLGQQL